MTRNQLVPINDDVEKVVYFDRNKGTRGIKSEQGYYNKGNGHRYEGQGGEHMDENTKIILERLDKDIRDHKQEVRDRDARLLSDAQERENRYRQELLEQQRFFREEAKEREERMMNAVNEMKTELKEAFKDVKEESRTTRNTVVALTISVILGVAAMAVAIFLAIKT